MLIFISSLALLITITISNIFIYKKISRNYEMYGRFILNSFGEIWYLLDYNFNSGDITEAEVIRIKKQYMSKMDKPPFRLGKKISVSVWILSFLAFLSIFLFCTWNHCITLPLYFIFTEAILFLMMLFALFISRLDFIKLQKNIKKFKYNYGIQ